MRENWCEGKGWGWGDIDWRMEYITQEGMDPKYFSFHSLRKGCITQMKALHMSKEETLARGSYFMDSSMINTMYDDDSSSRGPLAAIGSSEGRAPTKQDIQSRITPFTNLCDDGHLI